MDIVVTSAAGLIGLVTGGRSGERDRSLLSAGAVGFLVTPDGEVFWLKANTLPGLSRHGNLATIAAAG